MRLLVAHIGPPEDRLRPPLDEIAARFQ